MRVATFNINNINKRLDNLLAGERSWNGVAILARKHTPVLTCASLPGNPEDHQARYIEAAVQGVLIVSADAKGSQFGRF